MSMIYTRRRRSQSFGSYGSFKDPIPVERSGKPELIEGYAHLCFEENGQWFRGFLLSTDGHSSYTLSGKRTLQQPESIEDEGNNSPDVIRDFPSPMRTPIHGSTEICSSMSRQNSIDSRTERDLQFILEEIPMSKDVDGRQPLNLKTDAASQGGSQPVSRPGSPPSTQQIIRALDDLLIRSDDSPPEIASPEQQQQQQMSQSLYDSPFRSRSGSRSQQQMETISVVFDITVSDPEEGCQHKISHVAGRKGNRLTLRNRQLCFVTERSFWGQRADMIIQKQLAAPEMVGQGCHVFAGPMRFYFYNQLTLAATPLNTTNWCW